MAALLAPISDAPSHGPTPLKKLMPSTIEQLKALEAERCRCIVGQNYQRLGELLSPSLIHTHTRGNVDTRESDLNDLGGVESLELGREETDAGEHK